MKHDCEHCYHYIIQRGLFPHYTCLAEASEATQNIDGAGCTAWEPKPQWMNTRGKEHKFQVY